MQTFVPYSKLGKILRLYRVNELQSHKAHLLYSQTNFFPRDNLFSFY